MSEELISVGIDLGTTTTQVCFSRITLENAASSSSIPRMRISSKEIIYRGEVRFTPLLGPDVIDAKGVRELVEEDYRRAGFAPSDLKAGAVIITGETAKKENSQAVLRTLSGLAGDFVVATAGGDLESVIAGKGAGTDALSAELGGVPIANADIGGGTSNLAVFQGHRAMDTACLDIGGRQITVSPDGRSVRAMTEKSRLLCARMGLALEMGKPLALSDLEAFCRRLSQILFGALGLGPLSPSLEEEIALFKGTSLLSGKWELSGLTFSGGVADFIYRDWEPGSHPFPFGDIGPLLGRAIRLSPEFSKTRILTPKETIRATVVGAGSSAMDISGSTITLSHPEILPLKNIPILKMDPEDEDGDYLYFASRLSERLAWYREEGRYQPVAVSFRGPEKLTFESVIRLRDSLLEGYSSYLSDCDLLILLSQRDLAKSLGQALINALPGKRIISLDAVGAENGDYVDVGAPLAGGRVVPVVVKTLLFER